MNKLGDIELFVSIVQSSGLAAGAKKLGLSPASATARMNKLESSYGVRLLTRTTRKTSLTDEGRTFYLHCLKILQEVQNAEDSINNERDSLSGTIKITATVDLGKSAIAPLLAEFVDANPKVNAELLLVDHVVNLADQNYDLAVRYGKPPDSRMIARKLASNYRLMFASPSYIEKHGTPTSPEDLINHRCLGLTRLDRPLKEWYFFKDGSQKVVTIEPFLSSNDGSQIRDWALDGHGIALKSYLDVKEDFLSKRLVPILGEYKANYWAENYDESSDLYAVYPSKDYLPDRIRAFLDLLVKHFAQH